jgi:trk system potassium uptake protein
LLSFGVVRGRFSFHVIGIGLLGLAIVMLGFSIYAFVIDESWSGFEITLLISAIAGAVCTRIGSHQAEPSRREALLTVLLLWLVFPVIGAIPFAASGYFSPLDALFESMSGFTTTGATVLLDFAPLPRSLFMWRALTQWFGGV